MQATAAQLRNRWKAASQNQSRFLTDTVTKTAAKDETENLFLSNNRQKTPPYASSESISEAGYCTGFSLSTISSVVFIKCLLLKC